MQTHGELNIEVFVEPSFGENGYLLWTEDAPGAWVIDPGFPPQSEQLARAVHGRDKLLERIIITHCHPDHMAGVEVVKRAHPEAAIVAPRDEAHMLSDPQANLSSQMGMALTLPDADELVSPGDTLDLGTLRWQLLDVAGHSPGGLAFYCEAAGVVIVGDAIFAGGIGRYDFPGSSGPKLLDNIRRNLLALPPETVVYSGHGPSTTIGEEQRSNPFLQPGFAP